MIAGTHVVDEELISDALAQEILSPAFARALDEHARSRVSSGAPLRYPEIVYTDDAPSPSAYPACELVSISADRSPGDTRIHFEISCQWTVNGGDTEVMSRELKRLIAVTRKYFNGRPLLPLVGASPVQVGRTDYGPADARVGAGDFVKSAAVALFIEGVL